MRKLLVSLFFLGSINVFGTNYYVKTGGNDNATGLSDITAWKTISKANEVWAAGKFAPGDSILFKRGNTFYGTLTITRSGSYGSQIVIGAYGRGNRPVITGFFTITGWSVYRGGIYEAPVSYSESQTNMVLVDGIQKGMGRYPNIGTNLIYESHSGTTSITDNHLGDKTNWEGAEVVINKNSWTLDRCLITNHTGGTLTYTNSGSSQEPENNRYYFIQNDLRTLDVTNEWFHNKSAGKLYIYGNPSGKTIQAATLDHLIINDGYDFITIDGLEFSGSISHALNFTGNLNNCTIQNCKINNAGLNGIYFATGSEIRINNNEITRCNQAGIFCFDVTSVTIINNHIHHIALIPGQDYRGTYCDGIYFGYGSKTDMFIQYNNISYTGYNGIHAGGGTPFEIRNNYIGYSCQVINDGGGIYYPGGGNIKRLIDHNIVLNSGQGAPDYVTIARGIYADASASGSTITNNTVAGCKEAGIHIHSGSFNTITGNTCFNNGRGIIFQKISSPSTNTTFKNNKIIASGTQYALLQWGYSKEEMQNWGTFDNNFYARPSGDDYLFYYLSGRHTLAEWKTLIKQEKQSQGAPRAADDKDIHFIYNANNDTRSYVLSATMTDITGAGYSGVIELKPWKSLVLLGKGIVTELK